MASCSAPTSCTRILFILSSLTHSAFIHTCHSSARGCLSLLDLGSQVDMDLDTAFGIFRLDSLEQRVEPCIRPVSYTSGLTAAGAA